MTLKYKVTVSATLSNECPTGFSGPDNVTQLDTETQTNWHKNHNQLSKFSLCVALGIVQFAASCHSPKKNTVELSVALH